MIALSGAYTTIASGYKCVSVNPANHVDSDNVCINLININYNMLEPLDHYYMAILYYWRSG